MSSHSAKFTFLFLFRILKLSRARYRSSYLPKLAANISWNSISTISRILTASFTCNHSGNSSVNSGQEKWPVPQTSSQLSSQLCLVPVVCFLIRHYPSKGVVRLRCLMLPVGFKLPRLSTLRRATNILPCFGFSSRVYCYSPSE